MRGRAYMGIDVDTVGLAFCVVQGRVVQAADYFLRMDREGHVLRSYDEALNGTMGLARQMDAIVYTEEAWLRDEETLLGEGGAVERHARGSVRGYGSLERVVGEVLKAGRDQGVVVRLIAPAVWQRKVLGFSIPREALKAASMELAAKELAGRLRHTMTHHDGDAYCIARWAERNHLARMRSMGGEQLALVEA